MDANTISQRKHVMTNAASATATLLPALNGDVTIHYHVALLDSPSDEISTFWFDDAENLVCDLERKLGIRNGMGDLIMRINHMGVDLVHAHADPSDEESLVVAENPEVLESLLRGILRSIERRTAIENRTVSDADILATAEAFDVTGVSHDMMHQSTIDLADAAWKARAEIAA
jgi:hypothetical protein